MSKSCDAEEEYFLELVEIPEPCQVPWDSMSGDERVRFCKDCKKNVYNISGMSAREAKRLLITYEGEVCISMLKRADGTIVSDECPPILRPVRDGYRKLAAGLSALLGLSLSVSPLRAEDNVGAAAKNINTPQEEMKEPQVRRLGGKPMMSRPVPTLFPDKQIFLPGDCESSSSAGELSSKNASASKRVQFSFSDKKFRPETVDFSPYKSDLIRRLRRAWFPPAGLGHERKKIIVSFMASSTGTLSSLKLEQSSGVEAADKAAMDAVRKASPLRPLPLGCPDSVRVEFVFDYDFFCEKSF